MTENSSDPKAKFYNPPNVLKEKVGSGGLAKNILDKAQSLLEENEIDFEPIALMYMDALRRSVDRIDNPPKDYTNFDLMSGLINPIMQLKANGGMFHYPLVSKVSDRMIELIETAKQPDEDLIEIINAYHTTMSAILHGRLKGDGGVKGDNLYFAICDACDRYHKKHQNS